MKLVFEDFKDFEGNAGGSYTSFEFGHTKMYYNVERYEDPSFGLWSVEFGVILSDQDELVVHIGVGFDAAKEAAQKHFDSQVAKLAK